jgi:two-component system sensor histidine kinase KdpD
VCQKVPHINATTAGLLLVLLIVGIAGRWGAAEALVGAIAGGTGFDYLFLPPRGFAFEDPDHLVALAAFMVTAIASGLLFAVAKRRQIKAQERREEIEKLYRLGNVVMDSSNVATTPQRLAECLQELFGLDGVVVFDQYSGQLGRSGTRGNEVPDDVVHEIATRASPREETTSGFVFVPLHNGDQVAGAMGIHGAKLSQSLLSAAAGRVGIGLAQVYAVEKATQAEAARRSEELKSAVLDALAHELRSPLNSIKIAVTTLVSQVSEKDSAHRELLDIIEAEGDRLNSLIDDAIQISRLEAGDLVLKKEAENLQDLVSQTVQATAARAEGRRFEVSIPDSLPLVACDSHMLGKALKLLLDNALKYSPAGSVVTVSAECKSHSIVLSVANDGPGIPENERDRIFEKYYRGRAGRSGVPGTGLGLPSAKSIVEAHGGTIWVTSPPGGGAEFHMALPVAEVPSVWAAQA